MQTQLRSFVLCWD